jgi:hypothetical protein
MFADAGGGPTPVIVTVTGTRGSKPVPCTTNVVSGSPEACTMHTTGALLGCPGALTGPDGPHTVNGAGGGLTPPGGLPELLRDAPRITPATIRAAPTAVQPTQVRWVLSHCRQPDPASTGCSCRDRPRPSLRRLGGLYAAGSSVNEADVDSSPRAS